MILPDWKCKEEYDYVYELNLQGFAWEFLRRTKEYQDFYQNYLELKERYADEWENHPLNKYYPHIKEDFPLDKNSEEFLEICSDIDDYFDPEGIDTSDHKKIESTNWLHGLPRAMSYREYYGKVRWGLKGGLIDPSQNAIEVDSETSFLSPVRSGKVLKKLSELRDYTEDLYPYVEPQNPEPGAIYEKEYESEFDDLKIKDDYALVVIDMRKSISTQTKKVNGILMKKQSVEKFNSKSQSKSDDLLNHLRFLDSTAEKMDLADKVMILDEIDDDGNTDLIGRYKDKLKKARKVQKNWKKFLYK